MACLRVSLQDVPVLLTRGEYDEVSGQSALQVASGLPSSGGQVVTFKNSGSYMHIGEGHCSYLVPSARRTATSYVGAETASDMGSGQPAMHGNARYTCAVESLWTGHHCWQAGLFGMRLSHASSD